MLTSLAAFSLLIWIYLLLGRGGFWIAKAAPFVTMAHPRRRVVAVVPARNESEVIARAVSSLLGQDLEALVLVDDGSTDRTAELAAETAEILGQRRRLTILTAKPLVAGWTGKLWALSQGLEHALTFDPDYILFTDADIVHSADSVRQLTGIAEARKCDLASFMVRLECRSLAERALIPAFVFFFLQLYPPRWIEANKYRTAGAAGGCILIRPEALKRIGGLAAIRGEVIDDCALARAVKRTQGRIWLGLASDTRSIRSYGSFAEIGAMISRTAFNQLRHSALLLLGTVGGLLVTYIIPISALTGGLVARGIGVTSLLLMMVCYYPMVRYYGLSPWWTATLPAAAIYYCGATIRSAIQYWEGKGGEWKGRTQDVRS